ncbi:MAG: rRNA maturation RNase YbeY [Bdellovibrionales bacterium RIFOXYD1_FULL_44_7]|nr:MAG: rRNA maturation RNase YbeY [Bdellovibrionales bacterium RIFOXYD1_FULL_44_7]
MQRTKKQWEKQANIIIRKLVKKASLDPSFRKKLPRKPPVIDVQFITPARIKELNGFYRRKDQVTDILTFPAPKIFFDNGFMGELFVCLPVLNRQAREFKLPAGEELLILLVHGFLHLLGFTHSKSSRKAVEMEKAEKKLITAINPRASKGLIKRAK